MVTVFYTSHKLRWKPKVCERINSKSKKKIMCMKKVVLNLWAGDPIASAIVPLRKVLLGVVGVIEPRLCSIVWPLELIELRPRREPLARIKLPSKMFGGVECCRSIAS